MKQRKRMRQWAGLILAVALVFQITDSHTIFAVARETTAAEITTEEKEETVIAEEKTTSSADNTTTSSETTIETTEDNTIQKVKVEIRTFQNGTILLTGIKNGKSCLLYTSRCV